MCGITGFWKRRGGGDGEFLRAAVSRMSDRLRHRGPDAHGVWVDAGAEMALGHRRLSVLELSPQGAQPMLSRDGRHVLVFNGEIYNHPELRRALDARSRIEWRGRSDTETLVEAVSAFGFEGALSRASGMFAFAAWDRRDRALRLAVDRMGEKPLYYGERGGEFFFASELKAFKALPGWNPDIDRESLSLLLRFGSIPAPHSIWRGVRKLEPGTFLEVRGGDSGGFALRPGRYWDLREVARTAFAHRFRGTVREAADELESRLRAVIARQMVSDVPLGAFLSGGVDSSTVVALMQAQSSAPVKTFTIGFDSREHDETEEARRVAAHLGTEHVEERLDGRAALDRVPRLPEIWCEPFADSSQLPALLVSRLARRHVTVSLSGDGGDELFAGYNRHVWARGPGRRLDAWPPALRRGLAACLRALPPRAAEAFFFRFEAVIPRALRLRAAGEKIGKLAAALEAPGVLERYRGLVSHWANPSALLPGTAEPPGWIEDAAGWDGCPDPVERMQLLDMLAYLPADILTKMDRASMSAGLESRAPFLDPDVAAFALSLPPDFKIREGQGKWILRQVLYRHVPRELIERPKAGFAVPLGAWLRGPLRDWAETLLAAGRLRREGHLEPAPIRRAWEEHLSGKADRQHALWTVLMFQAWREREARGA